MRGQGSQAFNTSDHAVSSTKLQQKKSFLYENLRMYREGGEKFDF